MEAYGVTSVARHIHTSHRCPELVVARTKIARNYRKSRGSAIQSIATYARETDAYIAGHIKRCPVCHSMYKFDLRIGNTLAQFLLPKPHLTILLALELLQREKQLGTTDWISAKTGLPIGYLTQTVGKLMAQKLVAPAIYVIHAGHIPRKLMPWGVLLVAAYRAGLYVEPMDLSLRKYHSPELRYYDYNVFNYSNEDFKVID